MFEKRPKNLVINTDFLREKKNSNSPSTPPTPMPSLRQNERARAFSITMNNYTADHIAWLSSLECKYLIYGKEIAPTTGTPHLQGYVYFNNPRTVRSLIKKLYGFHIEVAKGTPEQNITYCKKDGDFFESGVPPMSQEEKGNKGLEYWQQQKTLAQSGDIEKCDPKLYLTHYRTLKAIAFDSIAKRKYDDVTTKHLWYYGPSRTGKSRKARTEHPDAYLKLCNKWWDCYNGQEVAIIEDFDRRHSELIPFLKVWADRYPFPVEVKNGVTKIRPRLIIVTSNYHPSEIWFDEKGDLKPIYERFDIYEFSRKHEPKLFVPPQIEEVE